MTSSETARGVADKDKGTAVLVLDFQNEFVSEGGKLHHSVKDVIDKTGMGEKLPKFIQVARECGALIIHSGAVLPPGSKMKPGDWDPHSYGDLEGLFVEGTWNAQYAEQVAPKEGDIVLKNRQAFDAFQGTSLAEVLESNNIGYFFIGGFLSNLCVEESMRTASDIEGLEIYALTDGCAAKSYDEHFVATTGTFPLFSTPVTCSQAMSIVRDLGAAKLPPKVATDSNLLGSNSNAKGESSAANGGRHENGASRDDRGGAANEPAASHPPSSPVLDDAGASDGERHREGRRLDAAAASATIHRFRLVQLNDVYLLGNLPRLAAFLVEELGLPSFAGDADAGKNFPYSETRTDRVTDVDGAATVTTTHTTTVVTLSGDFLGPSLLSSLDGGSGMVDVLHALGVTHVCLGNHEDDVPSEALRRHIWGGKFEWVNTNLRGLDDALDVMTEECCFVEVGGDGDSDGGGKRRKTVAILGLLSDDRGLYRPDAFGGAIRMVTNGIRGLESPARAIERVLQENRAVGDADLIVPLTHLDMADDVRLAERFGPGEEEDGGGGLFPVIIGGHDHDVFDEVHNGCRILKAGSDAHRAAVVEYTWREDDVTTRESELSPSTAREGEVSNSQSPKPSQSVKVTPDVSVRWIEAKDYEPHPEVQALVDDRRRVLHELETARLFRISEMLDTMRQWNGVLRPDEELEPEFSTRRNRFRTTGACTSFCGAIRRGLHADCCVLNAGGMRGNADYDAGGEGDGGSNAGWFTFADLKSEMPFPDPVGVVPMPGRVLERAVGFSRRASRRDPPEEDSGLLHLCDMVRYAYENDEDPDGRIAELGGRPFEPVRVYNVALPIALLNGMDDNVPLLEWARESGLRISDEAGKPVKVIFVETFALSFWSDLGSFAEMDQDGDGIITRDEVERAVAAKLGLDRGPDGEDVRYLKFLVDDILAVADVDGLGSIDLTGFLAAKLTAGIQEVSRRERQPSMFLQNMTRRELGRNARMSHVQRTVNSVKAFVQKRDSGDLQEDYEGKWHDGLTGLKSSLTGPELSISSKEILE